MSENSVLRFNDSTIQRFNDSTIQRFNGSTDITHNAAPPSDRHTSRDGQEANRQKTPQLAKREFEAVHGRSSKSEENAKPLLLLSLAQTGDETAPSAERGVHAASACEAKTGRAFPASSFCRR